MAKEEVKEVRAFQVEVRVWANVVRWGKVGRVKALEGAAQLGCCEREKGSRWGNQCQMWPWQGARVFL